jgi:TetR/AcrR family transcriptional regulator, transcriptional repressor for nem operon
MRVSRTQAEENRQKVIDVASRLFREHGFDGIGLKELMKGAGLTQGAFYKQFASKQDLSAQAASRALEIAFSRWKAAAEDNPKDPLGEVLAFYLSMEHRAKRKDGCPVVALGSDAARQGVDLKAAFEAGIKEQLKILGAWIGDTRRDEFSGRAMVILSTMVGAVVLARAVNDTDLARSFLDTAADRVRAVAAEKASGVRRFSQGRRRGKSPQKVSPRRRIGD